MSAETKQSLLAFMEQTGKNQRQIATELGISAATVSQFLSGTYPGDSTGIAESIEKYLVIAKERLTRARGSVFYEGLQNFQIVMGAAKYAHKTCDIVLVRGDAGAGKTTALNHYVKVNTGVIFVTANSCLNTANAILGEIMLAIGKQPAGKKELLMKSLVKYLGGSSRLIIIDEADHLTAGALQSVRNLNDQAHVGIVLAGNNKLFDQMIGCRGGQFDQLRTRIFLKPRVRNEYSIEEMQHMFPECDMSLIKILLDMANNFSLREADKLYRFGKENAVEQGIKLTASFLRMVMESIL